MELAQTTVSLGQCCCALCSVLKRKRCLSSDDTLAAEAPDQTRQKSNDEVSNRMVLAPTGWIYLCVDSSLWTLAQSYRIPPLTANITTLPGATLSMNLHSLRSTENMSLLCLPRSSNTTSLEFVSRTVAIVRGLHSLLLAGLPAPSHLEP